ncbi:phosphonate ABC transporter ATP-binding protein [Facklamia sp. DSM 111018]|uniref:Phosphonate ABC transporter ATP-binding protein n=1 Tax=Facklamia lactis TaxID=2749967 RepID=A0ABS0LUC3_9LACT|nr:phosphonate ABC transporter ATP-binding protein [Facklamia lactis]MBG9981170.1 phosphonate ABC transporter ATP-binding protein [Facklamia lactis]MBG9986971.1 phosphonate ABC transporter ATP-binding protein [Facklamia lactis]
MNLTIQEGEFVAIIGPSGAGKSTLIRCINRMHHISSGQITVNHTDIHQLNNKEVRQFRQKVGMVFQSFNLVSRISVLQNVLVANVPQLSFWQKLAGSFPREMKQRALEALDKVGILDKAYTRVDQLSGGQQQRVALARTLATQPEIILADEPVASLDPVTARMVLNDLKRVNQEMGITILLNIHHIELALDYADKILGSRKGEIIYFGPVSGISQNILADIYGEQIEKINSLPSRKEKSYV